MDLRRFGLDVLLVLFLILSLMAACSSGVNDGYKEHDAGIAAIETRHAKYTATISARQDLRDQEVEEQEKRNDLLVSDLSKANATIVALEQELLKAPPVPTATPEPLYTVEVIDFGGATWGHGSFFLHLGLVKAGSSEQFGAGMPKEAAESLRYQLIFGTPVDSVRTTQKDTGSVHLGLWDDCASSGDVSHHYVFETNGRLVNVTTPRKSLSDACWERIQEVLDFLESGIFLDDYARYPKEVLQFIPQAQEGANSTLFLSDAGRVLGHWQGPLLDVSSDCFHKSLKAIGWDDSTEGFRYHDPAGDGMFKLLYPFGLHGNNLEGPMIPDLCQSGNLIEVARPDWLGMQRYNSDEVQFWTDPINITSEGVFGGVETLNFSIHTDTGECNIYPGDWDKDRFLIELLEVSHFESGLFNVENRIPWATVAPGDLVLIAHDRYDRGASIFLSLDEYGNIHWYESSGDGPYWSSYHSFAGVTLISDTVPYQQRAWFDMVGSVFGAGYPYVIGGGSEIHYQEVPVLVDFEIEE